MIVQCTRKNAQRNAQNLHLTMDIYAQTMRKYYRKKMSLSLGWTTILIGTPNLFGALVNLFFQKKEKIACSNTIFF